MLKEMWEQFKAAMFLLVMALYTFGPCMGFLLIVVVLCVIRHKRQNMAKVMP